MKNIVLSTVAVLAMSSFAVAGGDIAPVEEPVVVVEESVVTDSGFYIGGGYGYLTTDEDETGTLNGGLDYTNSASDNYNDIFIQMGYKINSYVAIEGRYWFGISDTISNAWSGTNGYDLSIDAWGLYVKPMYPVTDALDVYALLGYGAAEAEVSGWSNTYGYSSIHGDSWDGFSWGLGASYSFTDNVSIFADFVRIVSSSDDLADYTDSRRNVYTDRELDQDVDTWNFGVSYKF